MSPDCSIIEIDRVVKRGLLNMLKEHFRAVEDILEVKGKSLNSASHPLHKGNGREFFVRGFLSSHLGKHVSKKQGKIITDPHITMDRTSKTNRRIEQKYHINLENN